MAKLYKPFLFFLAGAMLTFAFSPYALWPLIIISPFLWLVLSEQYLSKENFNNKEFIFLNFFFWFGFYSFGVSWVYVSINEYGYTPAPIAAFLALLFAGGLSLVNCFHAYVYCIFSLHKTFLLSFPATWVLMEWIRSWLLTGFPWLYSGYALIDSPLASFASIGGVYSLSFIAVFIACLIFIAYRKVFQQSSEKKFISSSISVITIFIIFSSAYFLEKQNWISIDENKVLRVHLIQGNIPQHDKWLPENQRKILATYNHLVENTFKTIQEELQEDPDTQHLIVLPEAAMPTLQSELSWLFDKFNKEAQKLNTGVVSGIFYDDLAKGFHSEDVYNSILGTGTASGLYHKQRLVPFGEYVPLEQAIRGLIPF